MADWYIDTWVNGPMPVTSPMAHSPGPPGGARRLGSTSPLVEPDGAHPQTLQVGAPAGRHQQHGALTSGLPSIETVKPSP